MKFKNFFSIGSGLFFTLLFTWFANEQSVTKKEIAAIAPTSITAMEAMSIMATCSGNADTYDAVNSTGVINGENAEGAPDNTEADVYEAEDRLVLDLTDVIVAGENYDVVFRRKSTYGAGTSTMIVEESLDNTIWTKNILEPTSSSLTTFETTTMTAGINFRYLRISIASNTGDDVDFDGVSYTAVECNPQVASTELNITATTFDNCQEPSTNTFTADWQMSIEWDGTPADDIEYQRNRGSVQTYTPSGNSTTLTFAGIPADGGVYDTLMVWLVEDNAIGDTVILQRPLPCPADVYSGGGTVCSSLTTTELGGNIWEDYNYNGIKDDTDAIGIQGVEVVAYDENGTLAGTTYTDSDGDYIMTGLTAGANYRVTFNLPTSIESWAKVTKAGSDNGTRVQFVTAGGCAGLGVASANDYCQGDPKVAISCYENGDGSTNTNTGYLYFNYSSEGIDNAEKTAIATIAEVGSVWGNTYDRSSKNIYTTASLKRHVSLGDEGAGGVYILNIASGYLGSFDLQGVVPANEPARMLDFGSVTRTTTAGAIATGTAGDYQLSTDPANATVDLDAFAKVGAMSMGDADISEDGNTLWTINLNTSEAALVSIDLNNPTYPLPTDGSQPNGAIVNQFLLSEMGVPSCPNGVFRPWALAFDKGVGYVGGVCSAENGGSTNDLKAYVLKFDPENPSIGFRTVFSFDLDFDRELKSDFGHDEDADWQPWADVWGDLVFNQNRYVQNASPIFSDIDFNAKGDMILGFADRYSMQLGYQQYQAISGASGGNLYDTESAGDIYHACLVDGEWVLEGAASCADSDPGTSVASSLTNDGINSTGEFYWEEVWRLGGNSGHNETASGGLAVLMGTREVMTSSLDPVEDGGATANTQGVAKFSTEDGSKDGQFLIVANNATSLGKSSGLSEPIFVCTPAPIEIGNNVWLDTDKDGEQDAGEAGIDGIVVELLKGTTVIATTTTANDGQFFFSNNTSTDVNLTWSGTGVDTALIDKTTYSLRLSNALGSSQQANLLGMKLTSRDRNTTISDLIDNDAGQSGTSAIINFTTGEYGSADHSLSFGFTYNNVIGNRIWLDENSDGVQDAGEYGIPGIVVELQDGTCIAGSTCPKTITDANGGYIFTGLSAGTYTVKVLSNVPTGLNAIYDEDDGTTNPDMETSVTISADGEYLVADFGYNYSTQSETNSPNTATLGAIGDRVWNDANGDGIQSKGETGIVGVIVNLRTDTNQDGYYETVAFSTTTGKYGSYIFNDLSAGAYVIEVIEAGLSSAGFTTTPTADPDGDNNNTSEAVILAPGDVWLGGDFGYTSAGTPPDIGSKVFIDVDGDGTYNVVSDLPLGGVTLALVSDTDGDKQWDDNEEVVGTTTTSTSGDYLFPDLPTGDYVVVITDVNNIIADLINTVDPEGSTDGISGLTLAGTDDFTQNFGFVPAGHDSTKGFIGDMIFLDADGGGDYDTGERGIEGVEVELLDGASDVVLATATTNENGMYYFGNLEPDNYKVKVATTSLPAGMENSVDPDGNAPGTNTTTSFAIAAGASNLMKDFGYKATTPRSISGTIWEDATAEGTLDGTETIRFEDVTLYLLDSDNNIIATTQTDEFGNYSFTQIAAGNYTVEVETTDKALLGYWHSTGSDSETDPIAVVVGGTDITGLDFGYYEKGAALGNIVWEDENGDGLQTSTEPGVPGVVILLEIDYDNNGTYDVTVATLTGSGGTYSFDNLLLDENYNGTGTTPDYRISMPNTPVGYAATLLNVNSNGNDQEDADDPAGVIAVTSQGQIDMTRANDPTTETAGARYDFGLTRTSAIGNYVWVDEDGDGIQDAGERGIPNIRVDLHDNSGALMRSTTTDFNGGYLFTNLTPATYTIKVVTATLPTGLNNQTYDPDGSSNNETTISLRSAEDMTIDFGYNWAPAADTDTPGIADLGAIGSKIWSDANGDGMLDPGEPGIKGVTLELWTDADGDGEYTYTSISTTTDAAGNYVFDDLPALGYIIRVDDSSLPGAYNKTPTGDPDGDADNESEAIVLAPGDVYLNLNFGYEPTTSYTIGSTVYLDENGNETFNTETGVANVTLALEDGSGDIIATTKTNESGAYSFVGLVDGSYKVLITDTENVLNNLSESGDPDGGTARESVVTVAGADQLLENFGFAPDGHSATKGLIGDLVFLDVNGDNNYTAGEPGIEGVTLRLEDPISGRALSSTVTDENGRYYFGNLNAGNYEVVLDESTLPTGLTNSVDPDGSGDAYKSGTITMTAAAINLGQDFGYKAGTAHTLSGTIWEDSNADGNEDESGTALENISVSLYDTDGNIINTAATNASGYYEFQGLPDGNYVVKVNTNTADLNGYWHSLTTGGTDNQADPYSATISGADVPDVDFGYHIIGAALGNKIWIDYDGDNVQDSNEPGLPGARITLEIDYNDDATADVFVVRQSDINGNYSFKGLLLDEDYNGTGSSPDFEIVVTLPDADMDAIYVESTANTGGNDKLDSDTHIGQIATLVQGQKDVSVKTDAGTETIEAAFDFGYSLNCTVPKVDYAMTADASDAGAAQTTDHFVDSTSVTIHKAKTQKNGSIRSWTYCESGDWRYYYNPLDPDEFLFAIEHGTNTTEIEYIEVRVDDNATDRYLTSGADATFVMVRDWHIKTEGDAALTGPVNIRFYFPPNEYKQMLDAAKAQAKTWGTPVQPTEAMVQWFNKPSFDPDLDITSSNAALSSFDMTSSRVAASDAAGNNTNITTGVENSKNHIQFDGVTGFSGGGGTAMIHLDEEALPVELSRFVGVASGCNVTLTWTAETEESFSHYEIERRADGAYEKIEEVKGRGGLTLSQTYQYEDKNAKANNYYRMKMIDLDGTFEYSPVVHVKTGCEDSFGLTLYPNPINVDQGLLNVKFYLAEESDVIFDVTDALGQVVKRLNVSANGFWNTIRMDVSDLPVGTYFVKIKGAKGASSFIVQE